MNLKKWSYRVVVALALTVFAALSASAADKSLGYGSGNSGSITHSVGSVVAKHVQRPRPSNGGASKVGGLRALSIDPSPEAMARLNKFMPVMYALLIQPTTVIPGMTEPTHVAAMDTVLLAGDKVSDDVIYQITKALHGGKKELTAYFQPLGDKFLPDKMAKVLPTGEYHAGAIKFYQEVGLWPTKAGGAAK